MIVLKGDVIAMKKLLQFPHLFFPGRSTWQWFILINVLIGATMSALDVSIVNVAMPTLKTEFNTIMSVIEWVAMSYMLTLTMNASDPPYPRETPHPTRCGLAGCMQTSATRVISGGLFFC